MKRLNEHFEEDPILREPFCEQVSFDETYVGMIKLMMQNPDWRERARQNIKRGCTIGSTAVFIWHSGLDPDTNVDEYHYLAGFTNLDRRKWKTEQQLTELQVAATQRWGWTRNHEEQLPPDPEFE